MISYFTQADADYGRRVREGLEAALKQQSTDNVGSATADQAVDDAKKMGGKTDGY